MAIIKVQLNPEDNTNDILHPQTDASQVLNLEDSIKTNANELITDELAQGGTINTAITSGSQAQIEHELRTNGSIKNFVDDSINDLSQVAKTGSYNDLTDKPTIPILPSNLVSYTPSSNPTGRVVQLKDSNNQNILPMTKSTIEIYKHCIRFTYKSKNYCFEYFNYDKTKYIEAVDFISKLSESERFVLSGGVFLEFDYDTFEINIDGDIFDDDTLMTNFNDMVSQLNI